MWMLLAQLDTGLFDKVAQWSVDKLIVGACIFLAVKYVGRITTAAEDQAKNIGALTGEMTAMRKAHETVTDNITSRLENAERLLVDTNRDLKNDINLIPERVAARLAAIK